MVIPHVRDDRSQQSLRENVWLIYQQVGKAEPTLERVQASKTWVRESDALDQGKMPKMVYGGRHTLSPISQWGASVQNEKYSLCPECPVVVLLFGCGVWL